VEKIDQQWIEIHEITFVIFGGKTDQVRERVIRVIENGVQEPLVNRDITMSSSFEEPIGRDVLIASRLQN
jgi:hypothetical protein